MDKNNKNKDDGMESDDDMDDGFDDYYNMSGNGYSDDAAEMSADNDDLELYEVENLTEKKVESLVDETVTIASKSLSIPPSLVKLLLIANYWDIEKITSEYKNNGTKFLIEAHIIPDKNAKKEDDNSYNQTNNSGDNFSCPVCMCDTPATETLSLQCQHKFCRDCWTRHVEVKITEGFSTEITCMAHKCDLLLPEDFALSLPISSYLKVQYHTFAFQNYVRSHPYLRFCVGPNCKMIFKANEVLAKRIICSSCNTMFCFKCGDSYHAPTDCVTIKNWLTKCADDSETANYLSVHTKDCPHCNVCIEKNGGCNHMQCYKCRFDFCWLCLGDWKGHGTEYYECSRYRENPDLANENAKARAALRKYLHYYERWQNHAKSLKLEEKTLEKIKERINSKVMNGSGTWIDWQYLLDAAALLAKCRYTLQYTYPYAYYMTEGSLKHLFEYQQAQLEAEIENLSWKIERAETTDRGDLENQMYIAEKRRKTLLRHFFQPHNVPQE
ncbi:potential E3 ubiquitin-protein ligase ariadne-2 [Planococcus citri]|uniref:potential E3 ubiquitin-protein ligase ariadne-2 n=1 Tax=Planococcus citri TaxID=170843 RepID=UPI0031F738FA